MNGTYLVVADLAVRGYEMWVLVVILIAMFSGPPKRRK